MDFFSRFIPKNAPFFEFLQSQNALLRESAAHLNTITQGGLDAEHALQRLNQLEDDADKLHRTIMHELSQTFITPIDREDIGAINMMQERCIDSMRMVGRRAFLDGFIYNRFPAQRMLNGLQEMTEHTSAMLDFLITKQSVDAPLRLLKNRREECSTDLDIGIAELMDTELISLPAVRELMLWVQLYDRIDATIELVSDLADTLEQVALKYV